MSHGKHIQGGSLMKDGNHGPRENGPMPGAGQMLQYHEQSLNSQVPLVQ